MVLFDMNLLCKDKNTITLMLPLKSKKKKKVKNIGWRCPYCVSFWVNKNSASATVCTYSCCESAILSQEKIYTRATS